MQAPIPSAEVRAQLAEVLSRPELRARESLLENLLDKLAPNLTSVEVRTLGEILRGVFVAAAVVVLVLLVRRLWLAMRAPRTLETEPRTTPRAARDLLRELADAAGSARAAGDLRLALRLFLHGLVVALGGRGDLEVNAAWTNRELLRRGKASREARALLEPLVRELEPKEFGRATVEAQDVERLEALLAPHLAGARGQR